MLIELPASADVGGASIAYMGTFKVIYGNERGQFDVSFSAAVGDDGQMQITDVAKNPEQDGFDVGLEIRDFPGAGEDTAIFALFGLTEEREGIRAFVSPETVEVRIWSDDKVIHDQVVPIEPSIEEVRAQPGDGQLCRYCEGSFTELPLP
jgi:hypothetical protein